MEELEAKLSEARSRHETETKAVEELRNRVSEQKIRLKRLESDVIAAESDLSAMRSEKDELGQGLMRDKEEVRGLQKMMKEIEDEKAGMKLMLEKLRKEARQQKGMVSIAKKQLSTAEGSRDSLQKDINQAEVAANEPEPIPSPARGTSPFAEPSGTLSPTVGTPSGLLSGTPRALSPAPTGISQRSNNPFDRLVRDSKSRSMSSGAPSVTPAPSDLSAPTAPNNPPAPSPPLAMNSLPSSAPATSEEPSVGMTALLGAGAAVGATAGVLAAGAETLYTAAKQVVSPNAEESPNEPRSLDEKTESFGAVKGNGDEDASNIGAVKGNGDENAANNDTDPFGAPAKSDLPQSAFNSDFDPGFDESFAAPTRLHAAPTDAMHLAPSSEKSQTAGDFDSAFSDFDNQAGSESVIQSQPQVAPASNLQETGIPSGMSKSAIPLAMRPETERSLSTQAMAPSSLPQTPISEVVPSEVAGEPEVPEHVRSEPVAAVPGVTTRSEREELASSEEENDEPEDLETPGRDFNGTGRNFNDQPAHRSLPQPPEPARSPFPPSMPILSPPLSTPSEEMLGKVRRSAPPPPAMRSPSSMLPPFVSATDDFDPFGAPAQNELRSLPPGAAQPQMSNAPKVAKFDDDDDFDFSELAPAQMDHSIGAQSNHKYDAPSAFDEEFGGFDDDFDKPSSQPNSGSDNSNSLTKSYEIVSPVTNQQSFDGRSSQMPAPRTYDEWGLGGAIQSKAPVPPSEPQNARGFSFDDAFGGNHDPA